GTAPFPSVDASKYNAIGIQATTNPNNGDDALCLGGSANSAFCPDGPEYNGCPNVLILNHFFDDATVDTHADESTGSVTTALTVVPCSEDFRVQSNNLGGATLQFLIFNEFEQRFSTSTSFTCWKETQLSDIGTHPGTSDNSFSIFNFAVQGTLSGQTRI